MTLENVILDLSIAGAMMFIGQLLRAKVRLFQELFIPASMIAGFLGLFLGKQFLNILPFSDSIGSYSYLLVMIVFAAVGIEGVKFNKAEGERIGSMFNYKMAVFFIQFSIPVLFTLLVLCKTDARINPGFGILLASGFVGGHGTAAAVGATFEKLGFVGATDLAMTFATVGILSGVLGGLMFIKWATKKGYTQYIKDFKDIDNDMRTGMVSPEKQASIGKGTVSSISIDHQCWHAAILMIPTGLALLFSTWCYDKFGVSFPEFTISFVLALVFSFILNKTGLKEKYVDTNVTGRISGTCTDLVVFFGISSIKVPVILEYAFPLISMSIVGIIIVFLTVRYFGARMNNACWFERSMFVYGYSTGVFAIGMILLRIIDPEMKSETLPDVALTEAVQTWIDLITWSVGPYMLMGGQAWTFAIIYSILTVIWIPISKKLGWWYTTPLDSRGKL